MRQSSSGNYTPGSVLRDEVKQINQSITRAQKSMCEFSNYFTALKKSFGDKSPRINQQCELFRKAETAFNDQLNSVFLVDLEIILKDPD